MFRKLILLLVSSVGCYSAAVFAVGLGEYELKSGLNQPLKAEIKLLSAGDLGEHEIHASLASAAVFERVGVERPYFLNNIRFETVRTDSGELMVKMSTREPIKEPFLNFLVELNSPKERVIREYTFLLDPPIFDETTSSTIEKTQAEQAPQAQTQQRQRPRQTTQQPTQASYTGSSYGPVSASDTLWSIASSVRPNSQVSIHQTLVAIYRANPEAFANGNINNLLRGKVLQIPDASEISQVPHRAALQDVVVQNRQWQSGGARRIVDGSQTSSTGNQMSGDARLTLATPDSDDVSGGTANSGLRNRLEQTQSQLVQSEETSATLQAENDELRARLADALKKLEGVQDSAAVNIDSTEMTALTNSQQLEDQSGIADDSSAITTDTTPDLTGDTTTDTVDTGDVAASIDDSTATDTTADTSTDAGTTSTPATSTEQASTTPQPVVSNKVYVPPKKKSFLDEMLESSAVIWGAGLAVILIVLAVFWRMRKRMEEDDFQDDLVASAGAGSIDTTETFELPDVGDDMLVELDMDDEGEEGAESDEENFDPLGEADIYIAYGKYEQAESLLLEAIDENPIRSDLKVKLMECYAENDDKEKFESLAQEVTQAVDAEEWREAVSALREQAWSDQGESEDEFDLPSTEDIFGEDDDFGLDDNKSGDDIDASGLDDDIGLDLDEDDDFSIDSDDSSEDEFDIDMDLGLDEEDGEEVTASEAVTETFDSLGDDEFSLDEDSDELDLNMDEDESSFELDEEGDLGVDDEEDSIDLDDSEDISLDLDEDEFNFEEDESDFDSEEVEDSGDEIATKLDLARAYIDMGDSDGAKEILSEVIAEGTDAQKDEARSLLEKAE